MTTRDDISAWFDRGVLQSATHMVVVCDTFEHDDYPCYPKSNAECLAKVGKPGNMQRVMEVYDLKRDKKEQLNAVRAWSIPTA